MADFGADLREARERKGISLRQIAAATKISVGALEALERNDISKLPGGIFSRAFVRSYAVEIGLDPGDTIRTFLAQFPSEAAPAQGVPTPTAGQDGRGRGGRELPIGEGDEGDFESKQRMAGVVLRLILISLPIAGAILYFSLRGSSPGGAPEAVTADPGAGRPADSTEAPAAPARVTPATPAPAALVSVPAPARPPTETSAAPVPAAKNTAGVMIEIAPTADCWIHLTVDGDVAIARVVRAGEHERHEFAHEAVLQVGDAAACAFSVNGRFAKPLGGAGQVREVRLTPTNYASFLQ